MRSLLFVPAKKKMLNKITSFNSDAYIIDLEDSILSSEKEMALIEVKEYLKQGNNAKIFIRLDKNLMSEQLRELNDESFCGYMIPKFEFPEEFDEHLSLLRNKEIIALVETPRGLVNIASIAKSTFVQSIAFGAEDYTSSVGMKNCAECLNYQRSRLLMYGKAFGKKVYDTPSFILDDIDGFTKEVQLAVDMGFDGKLAINPKQVETINELFQYYDFDYIKYVIKEYEESGVAVLKIDNKIYEKMHIAHLKRILKENNK